MLTPPRAPAGTRRSGGYSLVELVTVMVIIGVLAAVAIPRLRGAAVRAEATVLASDLRLVDRALLDYFVHNDAWPVPLESGAVPDELTPFLPDGFALERGAVSFAYEAAEGVGSDGAPKVSLRVADNPALLAALARLLQSDGDLDGSGPDGGGFTVLAGTPQVRKTGS